MAHLGTSSVAAFIGSLGLLSLASAATAAKVEICHIPPDNPANVQSISVSEQAAATHIAQHGDFVVGAPCSEGVGECEVVGESVCSSEDSCTASPSDPPEPMEVSCGDGLDNDCDGLTDTDDPNCACPCLGVTGWFDAIALTCPDGTPGGKPVINCDGASKLPDYTQSFDYCKGRPEHEETTVNFGGTPLVKVEYLRASPPTGRVSLSCVTRSSSKGFTNVPEDAARSCLDLVRTGCGLDFPE